MKQFFKILALAALALPFPGCDVEYSDINILPDPVFEQNGLYTVNTISIYDDYETVINVSRTAGLSKELELDIVVDETLLAEYNELYNTDYKLLEAQFYDIPKNAQLASTVKSVDISVRIHPKALIAAKGMAAANNMLLPIRISNASTPVEDGGSMMQALLRLSIVEPIVQVEMPEQMPQLEFIPTIPLPQEITLNATANFNTLEVAKIGYRVNASKVDAYNEEKQTSYAAMPEACYTIDDTRAVIPAGKYVSSPVMIRLNSAAFDGVGTFLLPMTIERVTPGLPVSPTLGTAYLRINGTYTTNPFRPIDRSGWSVEGFSTEEPEAQTGYDDNGKASSAIDDIPCTYWGTQWRDAKPGPPHWITIDMGKSEELHGFTIRGRADPFTSDTPKASGNPRIFNVDVSDDNASWTRIGAFTVENRIENEVYLDHKATGRYFRVTVTATQGDMYQTCIADIEAF